MNDGKNLPLENIHIYFCALPDLQPFDETSLFHPLKSSIVEHFNLHDAVLEDLENDGQNVIVIAFTLMKCLHDYQTYIKITEHEIRNFAHCNDPHKILPDYRPFPIITIGLEDIFMISENMRCEEPTYRPQNLNLDPRVKFFDASIWHRYVPLDNGFFSNFKQVLNEIIINYQNELYKTIVACEFMEFQTRALRNSFLAQIGNDGHRRSVTPYKYHSESLMKKNAEDELQQINNDNFANVKWNFLLVDDYGDVPLRARNDQNIQKTKKHLIEALVNDVHKLVEITNAKENDIAELESQQSEPIRGTTDVIKATSEKIATKMFDIILLDYLLGENTQESRREFGHELLEKITVTEELFQKKGPMNYFWIFPISVFSYAILDELFEKGISHFSEHWHLSSGADPVNTPQLFRYKLYRFMKMQLQEAGVIEEFKAIKQNIPKNANDIRNWASDIFGKLLLEFGNKKRLINDAHAGNSAFAKSVISSHDEIHYYEHLQHLVYLLAYGAGLEWPEMWHELEYLKSNKTLSEKLSMIFFSSVEKYILKLQSQYS